MRYFAGSILGCILAFAQTNPDDKCSIEGTVINSVTGEPIKKANVMLSSTSPGASPYATTTDASGHFLIDEVDAGRFSLAAYRVGYIQPKSPHGRAKYLVPFTLEKGQKLNQLVLNLAPQGVISGKILDEDEDPLGNVKVKCLGIFYERGKKRLDVNVETNTNELGEFRLAGLSPGKYVISATPDPNRMEARVRERPIRTARNSVAEEYATTYYPSTMNATNASPIEIIPGAQSGGINITLVRTRSLRVKGHVTEGGRSQRAEIMLASRGDVSSGDISREAPADAKGTFELDGVVPGSYDLIADEMVEGKRHSTRMPLEVHDVNIDGIELALEPPGEIQGRLVVEDNGDLMSKPFRLLLQSRADSYRAQYLHLEDESTFKVEESGFAGPYDVKAGGLPGDFYVKSIRLGERDVLESGFEFTPGNTELLILVLNPNGGEIEGSVKTAKDEPAVLARVTLIPEEGHRSYTSFFKTTTTDENGHFVIKGVAPGEYKIYAWEDIEEGAYQDADFMKQHESDGQAVSVKEKAHETVQLKVIPADSAAEEKPGR
jgi:protocatechuate 3,4-dioxygenase beta subunit